jgi:outer membrane protein OmpA-like peptidoglycan-associated protein
LMGPAIRRAVAHRLLSIMASLTQALAVRVSLRGLKWRREALRTGVPFAEGVMHFRAEQVFDLTLAELLALKEAVEQYTLNFVKDTTQLVPGQEEVLGSLSMAVQKLFKVAQHAGYEARLQSIGHTDKTGSEGKNRQLSQERAERILAVLTSDDIAGTRIRAVGVGSRDMLHDETTEADRMLNRRVPLRVMLPEIPGG